MIHIKFNIYASGSDLPEICCDILLTVFSFYNSELSVFYKCKLYSLFQEMINTVTVNFKYG